MAAVPGDTYCKPGRYHGYLEAEVRNHELTTQPLRRFTAQLAVSFAAIGSASLTPRGKATPYVSLPAARRCASQDARVAVTTNAKRAKRIASLSYQVNGRKAAYLACSS